MDAVLEIQLFAMLLQKVQLHSMFQLETLFSKDTQEVFSMIPLVQPELTMQLSELVGVLMSLEKSTTSLKTHGAMTGEIRVTC